VGLHAARRSNPQRCSRRPWRRPGELPAGARVAAHWWVPPPRQRSLHLPLLRPAGRRAMASRSGVEAQCPLVCSRPAAAPTRACRRPAAAPSPAHHRRPLLPRADGSILGAEARCRTRLTSATVERTTVLGLAVKAWEHEPSSSFREMTARSSPGRREGIFTK
jgi:hypothetical protein